MKEAENIMHPIDISIFSHKRLPFLNKASSLHARKTLQSPTEYQSFFVCGVVAISPSLQEHTMKNGIRDWAG
jgi:hypothetical protein